MEPFADIVSQKILNIFSKELHRRYLKWLLIRLLFIFFLSGFSFTDTDDSQESEEESGPSFIPLYHFHPLRNIQIYISTLYVRWLSHIFNCTACIYQTATWWDLPPYWITILLTDVILIFVCLLDGLILRFCYRNLIRETGGLEFASTITLVLQANGLIKCASHPRKN